MNSESGSLQVHIGSIKVAIGVSGIDQRVRDAFEKLEKSLDGVLKQALHSRNPRYFIQDLARQIGAYRESKVSRLKHSEYDERREQIRDAIHSYASHIKISQENIDIKDFFELIPELKVSARNKPKSLANYLATIRKSQDSRRIISYNRDTQKYTLKPYGNK